MDTTNTTISFNWNVSGDINQFEVTYTYTANSCVGMGGNLTGNIINGSVRSHTLRDLNGDSTYNITVKVIGMAGSTSASVQANTLTSGINNS